jgi:hypothetical protein
MLGACTLLHGLVTLPLGMSLVQNGMLAFVLWLSLSLLFAATIGWTIIIDTRGFLFSRTCMGLPLTRTRFPRQTPLTVDEDVYAPDGAEDGRYVRFGAEDGPNFGNRFNAESIKAALTDTVALHHQSSVIVP